MKVHDYTRRFWEHDYTYKPRNGGLQAEMMGWGLGLETGDYLLLASRNASDPPACYQIYFLLYMHNPQDMWQADVHFVPGTDVPDDAQKQIAILRARKRLFDL